MAERCLEDMSLQKMQAFEIGSYGDRLEQSIVWSITILGYLKSKEFSLHWRGSV